MTSSSGKEIDEIHFAHVISLMYKLISSCRYIDDVSIVSHRSSEVQEGELTNNRTTERKNHVGKYSKDVFCSAENQDNSTYDLG